jgi:hypothetical protein
MSLCLPGKHQMLLPAQESLPYLRTHLSPAGLLNISLPLSWSHGSKSHTHCCTVNHTWFELARLYLEGQCDTQASIFHRESKAKPQYF